MISLDVFTRLLLNPEVMNNSVNAGIINFIWYVYDFLLKLLLPKQNEGEKIQSGGKKWKKRRKLSVGPHEMVGVTTIHFYEAVESSRSLKSTGTTLEIP